MRRCFVDCQKSATQNDPWKDTWWLASVDFDWQKSKKEALRVFGSDPCFLANSMSGESDIRVLMVAGTTTNFPLRFPDQEMHRPVIDNRTVSNQVRVFSSRSLICFTVVIVNREIPILSM
jgi:hypothetical protein